MCHKFASLPVCLISEENCGWSGLNGLNIIGEEVVNRALDTEEKPWLDFITSDRNASCTVNVCVCAIFSRGGKNIGMLAVPVLRIRTTRTGKVKEPTRPNRALGTAQPIMKSCYHIPSKKKKKSCYHILVQNSYSTYELCAADSTSHAENTVGRNLI